MTIFPRLKFFSLFLPIVYIFSKIQLLSSKRSVKKYFEYNTISLDKWWNLSSFIFTKFWHKKFIMLTPPKTEMNQFFWPKASRKHFWDAVSRKQKKINLLCTSFYEENFLTEIAFILQLALHCIRYIYVCSESL